MSPGDYQGGQLLLVSEGAADDCAKEPSVATAAAAAAAAAEAPGQGVECTTCRGPRFSWDTVPAFIHTSNKTGPVNSAGLEMMDRFPLVTVEKFQGKCGNSKDASPACDQESQIIEVLRGVKSINANVSAVFCTIVMLSRFVAAARLANPGNHRCCRLQ